jgi:hypothetical protein
MHQWHIDDRSALSVTQRKRERAIMDNLTDCLGFETSAIAGGVDLVK